MTTKTLFLAWQDKANTRRWFPVGRLDADRSRARYRFRYVRGADLAHEKAGFPPLLDFPDLRASYQSVELFPLFKNRAMTIARPTPLRCFQSLSAGLMACSVAASSSMARGTLMRSHKSGLKR